MQSSTTQFPTTNWQNAAPSIVLGGVLRRADFNTTTDQEIEISWYGQNYGIESIWISNASISLTIAQGGVYTDVNKGGLALVANSQAYSTLTAAPEDVAGSALAATLTADAETASLNLRKLYFSLSAAQGAPATADLRIYLHAGMSAITSSGAPPPVSYTTGAVHFDGATILDLAPLSTTNSSFLLYSYWWRDSSDQSAFTTWEVDPTGNQFIVEFPGGDGGAIFNAPNLFVSDDPFTGSRLQFGSNVAGTYNMWHHTLVAMDVNHAPGARPHWMFLDDVDVTFDNHDDGSAFIITPNGKEIVLGGDGFGSDVTMDIADFWWGLGQFLDLSVTGNRRKFISSAGKPVDLGADGSTPTGTPPTFFLRRAPSAAAATFATDLSGNGNTFTITGALTNASSSPTD